MKALHQSTGTGIAYRDEGHGMPILLIHGWGVSGDLFEFQISGLSDRYRIVVPDLRGHGASESFAPGSLFSDFADGVAALITELELEELVLVGWSMGAMVAWDLVHRYPDLDIAGLVCIDMVPRLLNGPEWSFGLREGESAQVFEGNIEAMQNDWPAFAAYFVPRIFSSLPSTYMPQLVNQALTVALSNHPGDMARTWTQMAEQDFRAGLSQIGLPTLVVSGSHSQLYSVAAGEWVASQMPRARTVVFSDAGHAPHLEQPEQFNLMLAEFADSLGSQQGTNVNYPAQSGIQA